MFDHRLWKALEKEQQHLCLFQSVETLLCGFQQHLTLHMTRERLKKSCGRQTYTQIKQVKY